MERCHIYKLGIAILFYAIYYRRPMIVSALSTHQSADGDEYVYYQGVQGKPGVDFPVYARIPRTSFSCKKVESGYYADLETSCQVFHICNDGAKISFLCPNGTIFQQSELICEWWFKVNCTDSPNYYSESAELLREESWRKKSWWKSSQNRNVPAIRRKPNQGLSDNRQIAQNQLANNRLNKIPVLVNNEEDRKRVSGARNDYEKSIDTPFTRNDDTEARSQTRRKQANGDRGGRKFKQDNFDNYNVRNEITEGDSNISEESQVPEETSSFYKNNKNIIESSDKPTTNRYPNHKETYSEIQDVKFHSTKSTSRFAQTLPPQTYSTNRIPLNDGKPFVISTPKSSYNIHVSGHTRSFNDLTNNGVTTESFRYSPTVPPFTTAKKPYPTTVRPKIIVDGDAGSESSNFNLYDGFSSTFTSPFDNQRDGQIKHVSLSNSKGLYGSEYTTPNSIRTYDNHKGVSFTERINSFSGLDDIVHTPSTGTYSKISGQSGDTQRAPIKNKHDTNTRDSYNPSVIKTTSDKYGVGLGNENQNKPGVNKYEVVTNNGYYSYVTESADDKYEIDLNSDGKGKPPVNYYEETERNSNHSSVIKSSNDNGGSDLSAKDKFEANPYETTVRNIQPSEITYSSSTGSSSISTGSTVDKFGVDPNSDGKGRPSVNDYEERIRNSYSPSVIKSPSGSDLSAHSKAKLEGNFYETTTRNIQPSEITSRSRPGSSYTSTGSVVDKYGVNSNSDGKGKPSVNVYEETIRDSYRPSVIKPSSGGDLSPHSKAKLEGNFYETTTRNIQPSEITSRSRPGSSYTSTGSVVDKYGVDSNSDGKGKPSVNVYEETIRDSYRHSVIKPPSGSDLSPHSKAKLEGNFYETTTRNIQPSDVTSRSSTGKSHISTASVVDKYEVDSNSDGKSKPSVNSHQNFSPSFSQETIRDSYRPSMIKSPSDKYGSDPSARTKGKFEGRSTVRVYDPSTPSSSSSIYGSDNISDNISNIKERISDNIPDNNDKIDSGNKNKDVGVLEVVQHNSRVSENKKSEPDVKEELSGTESSFGDACGDDIVYPELKKDQIVVGKNKIVIDDTSVPTTETNIIKLSVNNAQDTQTVRSSNFERETTKPAIDSTIFRLNLKDNSFTEKPNGFSITKQTDRNREAEISHISTRLPSSNTYLPKQTSFKSSTENYSKNPQTKSHTYLPKGSTPVPFTANNGLLNSKDILKESSGLPQLVHTRDYHLRTSAGVPQISEEIQKEFALKPKPFELPPKPTNQIISDRKNINDVTSSPLPDYKVSSARPFSLGSPTYDENTISPTLSTPFPYDSNEISEHLSNMLNTLREIMKTKGNLGDSTRQGLEIPPSVGPQTLHTLAVYFANALDNNSTENVGDKSPNADEAQAINALLTNSTLNRFRELFKEEQDEAATTTLGPGDAGEESNDLEGQDSKPAVTPRVKQLAEVFTKAVLSYLDDPDMLKKVLQEARPTEPSVAIDKEGRTGGNDDDELLNYSDADIKPNLPRLSTTTYSPSPTWGYIFAPNNSNSFEYNSLNGDGENLQSDHSQSFATQFNNYVKEKHFGKGVKSTTPLSTDTKQNLPSDHWTSSDNATKLWQDKLYTSPQAINENFNIDLLPPDSQEKTLIDSDGRVPSEGVKISSLPKDELNSTEVHRILVDIVNSTTDDGNKLKRILNKLNTTQEDFLSKMREVEQNPLTRRLILLLISECGSNITKLERKVNSKTSPSNPGASTSKLFESSKIAEQDKFSKSNSPFPIYVDSSLKDDDEDTRALELLNSLYTIASKYGK